MRAAEATGARRSPRLRRTAGRIDGWLSGVPLYPWLLAAYPVIRLYSENLTEVEPGEVVMPLVAVLAATTIGMVVLSLLLRDPRRAALIVAAVVVPVLSFGLILDVLSDAVGITHVPLLVLGIAGLIIAVVVAIRVRGQLGAMTSTLNIVALVLLAIVAVPAARGVADAMTTGRAPAAVVAASAAARPDAAPTRDIYHLVLDRYSSDRAFQIGFGIDNSAFTAWLRDRGFQVVDDAHANYAWTSLSLASMFGMSLLDDVVEAAGPDSQDRTLLDRRVQESPAGTFLQDLGYRYLHLGSWFDQTHESRIADRVYRPRRVRTFASTLYDLTIAPFVLGETEPGRLDSLSRHANAAIYQFGLLDQLRDEPGPKYVFAHILLPHPPPVFLEDGAFAPDRASLQTQLAYTNRMLQRFLEPLLALPEDERPIIVLQGDEGFYPRRLAREQLDFDWSTATDEELITKFGVLDAMLLPGPEGTRPLPAGMTLVNTYPELLRRYFGADVADRPDRVHTSDKDRPLTMTDITDRLAAAERTVPGSTSEVASPATPQASRTP